MRQLISSLVGAASLLLLAAVADADSYHSKAGKFTVNLPGPPKEEVTPVTTGVGLQKMHMVATTVGKSMFTVTFMEVPPKVLRAATTDQLLEKARRGAINNIRDATLVGEKPMLLGPHKGHELTLTAAGMEFHQRFYFVKTRLYTLLIAGVQGALQPAQVASFFDSFKLD